MPLLLAAAQDDVVRARARPAARSTGRFVAVAATDAIPRSREAALDYAVARVRTSARILIGTSSSS